MKLKRACQLAEELATFGFDGVCGDISDQEDTEYREAMDYLWSYVASYLNATLVSHEVLSSKVFTSAELDELQTAIDWLRMKGKWT